MDTLLFMQKLNEGLFEEQRILKLHSASLIKDRIVNIVFICEAHDYDAYLNDDLMQKIQKKVREIVPEIFDIHIAYKKTYTEEKYIIKAIMDYVYKEYPTIFSFFQNSEIKIKITGNEIKADIYAEKYIYKFCETNQADKALQEYLNCCFMETPSVRIIATDNKTDINISIEHKSNQDFGIKLIDISVSEHLLGVVGKKPRYISEVKDNEIENITVCGVVTNLQEKTYKKQDIENSFYIFSLNDTTDIIDVKFFPRSKKAINCASLLNEGDKLVIEGPLRFDKFSNSIALYANRIARCDINYESIDTAPKYKKESDYYENVHPKPYINEEQKSLFSQKSEDYDDLFKGKTFVVFDLETTGVTMYDKITEIGAIKIVDGRYTEMFHTLVNPQIPIPSEVTKLTGITQEMVKNAPVIADVIGDFYKFTRNSILVAHNASFDVGFITREGKENLYNFDNTVVDTLTLAKQNLKLKKYKLAFVCKELNVELDNAHRSMSDTLATANIFKKLMILKEKE